MRKNVKIQKKQVSMKGKPPRHVHMIVIPDKTLKDKKLKWTAGTELEPHVLGKDVLVFRKVK